MHATGARALESADISGFVRESSGVPIAGARVVLSQEGREDSLETTSDSSGFYRFSGVGAGVHRIRASRPGYEDAPSMDVTVASAHSRRLNLSLRTTGSPTEVTVWAPSVDVRSTSVGTTLSEDFLRRMRPESPIEWGSASRSFESSAEVAPTARADLYGITVNGTSSPENHYRVDGLNVGSPAFGIISIPLSVEFAKEVQVRTGGFMPEYGRAMGTTLDMTTKSGGLTHEVEAYVRWVPGGLEGGRAEVRRAGTTVYTDTTLSNLWDVGALGSGPLPWSSNRLRYFVGIVVGRSEWELARGIYRVRLDSDGSLITEDRLQQVDAIDGTARTFSAVEQSYQYIAKVDWHQDAQTTWTATAIGHIRQSGGGEDFGVDPLSGLLEVSNIQGAQSALAHTYSDWVSGVSLAYRSTLPNGYGRIDGLFGWHHEQSSVLPADGSGVGSGSGLSDVAQVSWRRSDPGPHSITDFESVRGDACDPAGTRAAALCPVPEYDSGGPGLISESVMNRYQTALKWSRDISLLGHHLVKAGFDSEISTLHRKEAYSGGVSYLESTDGTEFSDYGQFGYLTAPDTATLQSVSEASSQSVLAGGWVQDSWDVMDFVTLNVGLRYDAQLLYGDDGRLALALPHQWAPRAGLVYDFARNGRSKVYVSYGRYYETLPLTIVDRLFGGESEVGTHHDSATCDPRDPVAQKSDCQEESNRLRANELHDPNQKWSTFRGGQLAVDPDIGAQSSDEYVVGAEYEPWQRLRVGLVYTHRGLNKIIEDMTRDETATFFLGNPGYGIAEDIPEARRDFDGVTLYVEKDFFREWLLLGSVTLSRLYGNYAGLFQAETGILDPNLNADFDQQSLLVNREGPLATDRTLEVKLFGAKEFTITPDFVVTTGAGFVASSGEPTSYLGSDPLYGAGEVFVLPRGDGERLPWFYQLDAHLSAQYRFTKSLVLELEADIFNVLNLQAVTQVDEDFTYADVLPIDGGEEGDLGRLRYANGQPFQERDRNPNFGKPVAYQEPRMFRFGARMRF